MPRPFKPLQKRPNGVYFIQLHLNGKRRQKSLETKDPIQAQARAAQAMEELRQEAAGPQRPRWRADEPVIEWDIPSNPDGSNDYENAKSVTKTWGEIAPNDDEIARLTWRDLVREAETVRKRKSGGKGYSDSWHEQMRICLVKVPFKLEDCTPQAIRAWVRGMQDEGLAGRSIELRCAMFRGIVQTAIKSGLLEGHDNPWKLVDFSSNSSKPIYTAREEDYRKVSTFIDSLPDAARLPLLIQIYTGCRISEVLDRKAEDFDLEAQTMSITEGKNKFSIRTIPLPAFICDQLRSSSFKFWRTGGMNKLTRTRIHNDVTSHSWRHGITRLGRDLQADTMTMEAVLGHKLPCMQSVYGSGFSVPAMRTALAPVWQQLDQWVLQAS